MSSAHSTKPAMAAARVRSPQSTNLEKAKPKTMDDYLAPLSDDKRAALEKLRRTIRNLVPEAQEGLSYGLAAFRLNDRPLVAFGAAEHHCAFYPMSSAIVEAHQAELKSYDTSKGTIRFAPNRPLPVALVRKLVKARVAELQAARSGRRAQPRRTPGKSDN